MMRTRRLLIAIGAFAVLVSGYMHFYLYFRGGYRGISPERLLGLDISRSFALTAIAAVIVAELLVLALRFTGLETVSVAVGVIYALGALVAYALSRTTGLLGFTESRTTVEAVISKTAELVAAVSLAAALASSRRSSPADRKA